MAGGNPEKDKIFLWWIEHHQHILAPLLGADLKAKYYGGFALNAQLGAAPDKSLKDAYLDGTEQMIKKHPASDIDMKLFGFKPSKMVINRIASGIEACKREAPQIRDIPHCLRIKPARNPPFQPEKQIITIAGAVEGLPTLKGVVAHILQFAEPSIPTSETGIQIIITAITDDGCLGLSELTCFYGGAAARDPPFEFMDISTLCEQFIIQLTNLRGLGLYDPIRINKTLDRIIKCLLFLREKHIELTPKQDEFWRGEVSPILKRLEQPPANVPAELQPPPVAGGAGQPAAAALPPQTPRSATSMNFIALVKAKAAAAAAAAAASGAKGGGRRQTRRQRRRKD
jgi:hypothetical protein